MKEPKKMDLSSKNITEEQKDRLKELFPHVFNEDKIDFERLKQTLGESIDAGLERFGLTWPGKAECMKIIQEPSIGTLKPCKEESVNFDSTENLFIEGDNLEVLKLLQKSYYGKVKMIYIDPPYNTGKEFIYPDKYSESLETYLAYTGQVDAEGKKFSTNTEAEGRFHSKWINMMYPRLFLARNLLRDDGVVFISIDDHEADNLKKICDEIFGGENFLANITRVAKTTSFRGNFFAPSKDYILCYSKNASALKPFMDEVIEEQFDKVETDGERRGERYRDDIAFYLSTLETRPNQRYFIECPDGSKVIPPGNTFPPNPPKEGDGVWRWSKDSFNEKKHLIVFKQSKQSPLIDKDGKQAKWNLYTKSYLKDKKEDGNIPRDFWGDFLNRHGTSELKALDIPYSFPKPVRLVQNLLKIIGTTDDDIVFDFFAGSSTTAHAVIELNFLDKKRRKFVLVQLPEDCEEEIDAKKAGFKNLADIGKERIRRVINKIAKDEEGASKKEKTLFGDSKENEKLDLGFKVFKLHQSNFKIWDGSIKKEMEDKKVEKQLELQIEHINPKANEEDILYELLLKSGFALTTKVEALQLAGKKVYSIENNALLICLEKSLTKEVITEMARKEPARVVCLDIGFAGNDQLKTNAVQIMKSHKVEDFRTV